MSIDTQGLTLKSKQTFKQYVGLSVDFKSKIFLCSYEVQKIEICDFSEKEFKVSSSTRNISTTRECKKKAATCNSPCSLVRADGFLRCVAKKGQKIKEMLLFFKNPQFLPIITKLDQKKVLMRTLF